MSEQYKKHQDTIDYVKNGLAALQSSRGKQRKNKLARELFEYIRDNDVVEKFTERSQEGGPKFAETTKKKLIELWQTEPVCRPWIPGIYKSLSANDIEEESPII